MFSIDICAYLNLKFRVFGSKTKHWQYHTSITLKNTSNYFKKKLVFK